MTDKELLIAAAKAAGIPHRWNHFWGGMYVRRDDEKGEGWLSDIGWNPLTDDGDALRLAVRLCMELSIDPRTAWAMADGDLGAGKACEVGDDPLAATRRAIVRAAAEIGRSME